jgi:hypothetical protein
MSPRSARRPRRIRSHCTFNFVLFAISFEITTGGEPRSPHCVIPAWRAGIQADMDVSGRILRAWMPAIHAGMTIISIFMFWGRAEDHESLRGEMSVSILLAALPR